MSQDKRGASDQKHISMDLTADGARVTNLSLQGNRLVLTIEAELADSQLRTKSQRDSATTVVTPPLSASEPKFAGAGDFAARPHSADAPSLGNADPRDAVSELFGLGSENLPPAQAEHARHSDHMAVMPDAISEPNAQNASDMFRSEYDFPQYSDPHDHRGHVHDHGDHAHPHMHDAPAEVAGEQPYDSGSDATPPAARDEFAPFPQDDFIPASPVMDADADSGVLAMSEGSSSMGGERHGEPLPAFSFGSAPAPEPAPIPQPFAPQPSGQVQELSRPRTRIPEDAPTQFDMRPVTPPPPLQPAPAPEPPKAEDDAPRGESGGTTVLIRYTCPRCKTQGMQAVDKVGTVVNCSNCGKAMRLVMKK